MGSHIPSLISEHCTNQFSTWKPHDVDVIDYFKAAGVHADITQLKIRKQCGTSTVNLASKVSSKHSSLKTTILQPIGKCSYWHTH